MDGNPEGTPNPLNPVQGVDNASNEPQPSTDAVTETEALEFIEADTPTETQTVSAVDEYVSAAPASFANSAAPASPAMPQMATATPKPARPSGSVVDPMMRPVSHANPASQTEPSRAEASFESLASDSAQPDRLAQDIEQVSISENFVASDSIVEPEKKSGKKKGLLIGAIAFILIAIACAGTAIAVVMMNNSDPVTAAIDKLLNGQVSSIIGARGTISSVSESADYDDEELSEGTSMSIDFDGTIDTSSLMNEVEASVSTETSGMEITLNINELTNKDGDTYFKISGLDSILKSLTGAALTTNTLSETTEVLDTSDDSLVSAMTSIYSNLVNQVEDKWILASGGVSDITDNISFLDNSSMCLVNAFSELPNYGKDLAAKYKANPFITSSKDNLAISKKKNELYKLGYNKEKLNAFISSVGSNGFVKAINSCSSDDEDTDSTMLEEIFNNFPTVYVEIDKNNNFTRVYFATTIEASGISTNTKADIDLTYPTEIRIVEPDDYIDINTVFINMFSDSTASEDADQTTE